MVVKLTAKTVGDVGREGDVSSKSDSLENPRALALARSRARAARLGPFLGRHSHLARE